MKADVLTHCVEQASLNSENAPVNTEHAEIDQSVHDEQSTGLIIRYPVTDKRSFKYTHPFDLEYAGRHYSVRNWKQLYIQAVRCVFEEFPDRVYALSGKSIRGRGRTDVSDSAGVNSLCKPARIAENLFLETNESAGVIVEKVGLFLDKCNIDRDKVTISYFQDDNNESADLDSGSSSHPESKAEDVSTGFTLDREVVETDLFSDQGTNTGLIIRYPITEKRSYRFTQPFALEYVGRHYSVRNWKQAYVQLVKCLLSDFPDRLLGLKGKSIRGSGRTDIADETGAALMREPKEIGEGLFLETNENADTIVWKVGLFLDLCGIGKDKVAISYYRDRESKNSDRGSGVSADPSRKTDSQNENWPEIIETIAPHLDKKTSREQFFQAVIMVLRILGWKCTNGSMTTNERFFCPNQAEVSVDIVLTDRTACNKRNSRLPVMVCSPSAGFDDSASQKLKLCMHALDSSVGVYFGSDIRVFSERADTDEIELAKIAEYVKGDPSGSHICGWLSYDSFSMERLCRECSDICVSGTRQELRWRISEILSDIKNIRKLLSAGLESEGFDKEDVAAELAELGLFFRYRGQKPKAGNSSSDLTGDAFTSGGTHGISISASSIEEFRQRNR